MFSACTSIQVGEGVCKVELEHWQPQRSLSVDGSRVWVYSPWSEPLGWDFRTPGSPFVQLSNSPLLFAKNGKLWNIVNSVSRMWLLEGWFSSLLGDLQTLLIHSGMVIIWLLVMSLGRC